MSSTYEHSKVFDDLKRVKEKIKTNFSSLQYLQTLDYFVYEALKPIAAECPSLFYSYLTKVVARQTLKSSAKLTSNDRQKLPVQLFNALIDHDPARQFEQVRKMHLNRGLIFGFISFFLSSLELYERIHNEFLFKPLVRQSILASIEQNIGLRAGGSLYAAIQQIKYWDTMARQWKGYIIEKYTRLALMQAQRAYRDFNHSVRLDDVSQIYLIVVSKAIDRCDSRQGVLTTFIQNWFKSAKGEVGQLAEVQKESSFEGLVEEHGDSVHSIIGVTLPDLDQELRDHVAYVAYTVDPQGLIRTSLGIPQYVSRSDRQLLEALARD